MSSEGGEFLYVQTEGALRTPRQGLAVYIDPLVEVRPRAAQIVEQLAQAVPSLALRGIGPEHGGDSAPGLFSWRLQEKPGKK